MALMVKINTLKKVNKTKPSGILTIYLDTDRSKPEQQQGQWKLRLKNGLKKLEEYLVAEGAQEEKSRFAALSNKVESEILSSQREHQKGLILVASDDFEMWHLEILQVPVKNQFNWDRKAELGQLEEINTKYPCSGIVLAHRDHIRVVDTSLGQIIDDFSYQWQIDTEDWTYYKGPAAASGGYEPSSSSQNDSYMKRKEVHISREITSLLPKLQQEAKKRKWKGIYLIADPSKIDTELISSSFKHLEFIDIVPKNSSKKSAHDLLKEII